MATPDRNATSADWVEIGCTIYMALVITINVKLAMRTRHWTWPMITMSLASILTLFLFYYLYGLIWITYPVEGVANMAAIASRIYTSPQFWLSGVLLAPSLALLPDFTYAAFQRLLWPKAYQVGGLGGVGFLGSGGLGLSPVWVSSEGPVGRLFLESVVGRLHGQPSTHTGRSQVAN